MDKGCVRVAVRIRPLVKSEVDRRCQIVVGKVPSEPQIVILDPNWRNYTFNYVFESKDTQKMLYDSMVYPMLENLYKGYNVSLLAYGQTGSGKTHTVGTAFNGDFSAEMGVIPRAMSDIFEHIKNTSNLYDFDVSCSFIEIYQEQLFDLLSPRPRDQTIVDIREDKTGILIPGLTETKVSSALETTDCLIKGSSGLAVGATAMNQKSSKSHAIFTVTIQMTKKDESKLTLTSKLNFVDLAGSDKWKITNAIGNRLKESVQIYHNLFVLRHVISALGNSQRNLLVNYSDSKLTNLLQDSLGGNSIILMIACVSPADYNLEETKITLNYAHRAGIIKSNPIINQYPNVAEINRINGIIQKILIERNNSLEKQQVTEIMFGTLDQLKQEVSNLKKKNLQQSIILKDREKEAQKIEYQNSEIQAIQANKIRLMEAEIDNFRQWNLTREEELTQLEAKSRKRENDISRMESLHNTQRNVLKCKVEEAMSIIKRLADALEKQKVHQTQRKKNILIGEKDDQTLSLIERELDVIISATVIDAEHSLEQLLEDRAVINSRLNELIEVESSNTAELKSFEEELGMRNAQINDIQQKLVSTNIQNKMKGLCDGIQSIPEAQVVLKHIFNVIADMRKSFVRKDSQIKKFKN